MIDRTPQPWLREGAKDVVEPDRTPQPWRRKAHPNAKALTKPDPNADPDMGVADVEPDEKAPAKKK